MMQAKHLKDISIQYVKGVGPSRKRLFAHLGVETVEDMLYFFPRRYEDRRQMISIAEVALGECQTVAGTIIEHKSRRSWHTKKHVCEICIDDGKGKLYGVWFNQVFMSHYFHLGQKIVLYGKIEMYKDRLQIISPEYEIIDEDDEGASLSIGRIVPIYPLTKGLTQRYLRRIIKFCFDHYVRYLEDALEYSLREKYHLLNFAKSLANIHFPESFELHAEAMRRVSFEEFFFFQVSVLLRKMSVVQKTGIAHDTSRLSLKEFEQNLQFALTNAQKKAMSEIANDAAKISPMHRLLQGEVGSGKTVVALYGCLLAVKNNTQAVIMAPTEILARQHYDGICQLVNGDFFKDVHAALLIGSLTKKEKDAIYEEVRIGKINLLIGTHALIQEALDFKDLSFVVIDEQHKFGVRQRALLPEKGKNPDVLIMTATPIPRTLCLTLYGDLDISTLNELPPGRGNTETIFFLEKDVAEAYEMVRNKINEGQQAYIIYPIIDDSEKLDLKAAEKMFRHFKKHEFKDFRLGLVHGQMDKNDTVQVMRDFKARTLDILVATTILEVGIDVSDANVMVIEHAERFGLSQLHQLRGRIGRGSADAVCVLVGNPVTPDAAARIDAIVSTNDGFVIAQKDLMIRGPGQFFGRHQHGLNELRFSNPATQLDILEQARKEAIAITSVDPHLAEESHTHVRAVIEERYPTYLLMARAG